MTTTQMAYFLAMTEKRSFTSVAEQFYVTQPTLSRQIMNLETELGVQLFTRKSNSVSLTSAGAELYDGLKPLYGQLTRLVASVKRYEERRKAFTIGIAAELLLDDAVQLAIGVFSGEHPEVNVSIVRTTHAELQRGLLDGSIDAADTITSSFDMSGGRFGFLCIEEERVHLACSRALYATLPEKLPLSGLIEVLRGNKLLLGSFDSFGEPANTPTDVLREAFGPLDFEPEIVLQSSPLSIPAQVASGLGVSLCNKSNLFAIDPKTAIVEIDVGPRRGTIYPKGLVYAQGNHSPLLRRFLEITREKIAESAL